VDAFVVDPNNSQQIYAGTDVGVYASTNGGTSWAPYGTGLPVVAVFDMAIVKPGTTGERIRIATHGRSMWENNVQSNPTAVTVASIALRRIGADVRISWRTATETGIAGFNVFRAGSKLNRSMIPARQSGRAEGATYRFLDRHAPRLARYRLQVISLTGTHSWYGVGRIPSK
jgi:hypothetical protein